MCFSATASFATAGVVTMIGLTCLQKSRSRREWPLAAMPLLFGLHQSIEGLLWLTLETASDGAAATTLTFMFLVQAEVIWPAYAPFAALLVEPDRTRRLLMYLVFAAGLAAGVYLLRTIVSETHTAEIVGGHIVYHGGAPPPVAIRVLYLLAACAPAVLSSHPAVQIFAGIVTIGAWITYAFYVGAFTSVWCFFAAAASVVLLLHFVLAERRHLAV